MDQPADLPGLTCPVRVVYGTKDRILPDVAKTIARVQQDLPQTELSVLDDCGHFLQEDRPEEVGELLAAFFGNPSEPHGGNRVGESSPRTR